MDEENPECVLDSLIQYQRQEIQVHGEPKHFTDELLGVLVFDIFTGGKDQNFQFLNQVSFYERKSGVMLVKGAAN